MILLWITAAWCQVNNEHLASRIERDGLGVGVGVGGAMTGGNLQMLDVHGQLGVQWRRSFEDGEPGRLRDRASLTASGAYLGLGGVPFLDRRLVTLGATHMFTPRLGVEGGAQYQNDLVLLLTGRWTTGAAMRAVFLRGPRGDLSGGAGFLLEHEDRNVDPQGPDPRFTTTPRLSGRLTWNVVVVPDRLTWRHTVYAEPRVDDWNDLLIVDYHTLEVTVTEVVAMTLDATLRYDALAPAGLSRFDRRLTWSLRFRWARGGAT
jgi:hypothetical protein